MYAIIHIVSNDDYSCSKMYQNNKMPTCCVVFLLIFTVLAGCKNKQKQPEITVFSAMSLTDALSEIGAQFTEKHDVKVIYNFAASTTLQRQIEKGAYADVFISASSLQANALEKQNLLETDTRFNLLGNRLVLVSHKNYNSAIEKVDRLTDIVVSRIAIGQPEIVPAGTYAKEVFIRYGIWEKVFSKLVFGTDVRATLAYVSTGNVDLAIVYHTDVTLSKNVKVLYEFPAETHSPIAYPAVVLKVSEQKQFANQFMTYLSTPFATEIFEKHGFIHLSHDSTQ